MSSRKLVLALALLAFAGGAWAGDNAPKRESQPAPATSQDKQPASATQSSSASQPAASQPAASQPAPAAEPRESAPNDASTTQGRRHPGTTPSANDFANKYYPGG